MTANTLQRWKFDVPFVHDNQLPVSLEWVSICIIVWEQNKMIVVGVASDIEWDATVCT